MKVKFLDLQANYQTIKTEVDASIHNVLNKNNYILGCFNCESPFSTLILSESKC